MVMMTLAQASSFREKLKERFSKRQEEKPAPIAVVASDTPITKPGDYTFTFVHNGISRFYKLHVPGSYKAGVPTPLVFAFHGGGGNMSYMADDSKYGLISKSEQAGFIAVFPNGTSKYKSGILATWNAGEGGGYARENKIDDVGFVKEVIAKVSKQLSIDPKKIFSTGMSNGASLSYRLACEMSDVFKAIAPVAGTNVTKDCSPKNPISILHIHAKNDDHVQFNGGAGKNAKNLMKNFVSVPATIEKWVSLNGCNITPKRVLEKIGAYCDLYSSCKNNVEVKLCVTETGAHSWPGGKETRASEPTSKAISANDVLWDFFLSQGK